MQTQYKLITSGYESFLWWAKRQKVNGVIGKSQSPLEDPASAWLLETLFDGTKSVYLDLGTVIVRGATRLGYKSNKFETPKWLIKYQQLLDDQFGERGFEKGITGKQLVRFLEKNQKKLCHYIY